MRSRSRIGGWALVCALLLSACAAPAPVRGWLPHRTPPMLKIGLVAPFEGRYRSLGYDVLYGVKWAVRQRNEAGGVGGYLVEWVALDDGDAPDSSAFQAAEFAVDSRVVGVIGPFGEDAVAAAAPVYQQRGLAMLTPATCPAESARWGAGVFCYGASPADLSRALVAALPSGSSIDLLRARSGVWGDGLSGVARRVYLGPWTSVSDAAWRDDPADLYLYEGDVLSAADALLRLRALGIDAPLWGGPELARAQLCQIAGDACAGVCTAQTAALAGTLKAEGAFVVGYRQLAGSEPGLWAALAYEATELLLDAIERSIQADGRPSRDGVIRELAAARDGQGELVFSGQARRAPTVVLGCPSAP